MDLAVLLVVVLVALPVLTFAVECVVGAADDAAPAGHPIPPRFAVIMPAHDEALGVAAAIDAARAQLRGCDRLIVVADNCTDATAAIARAHGAEVVERHSAGDRGKGFALAAGRAALAADPPPVVIVLDADCAPAPGALPRLAAAAVRRGAAIQGCYLLTAAPTAGAAVQLSTFAFAVKNLVRQRGLRRLGLPALLQGSGMAFPWTIFAQARLASANLVEDLELGLDLVRAGHRVGFAADAVFTSAASSRDATVAQRTRWEHGTMTTAARRAPALLAAAVRGRPALFGTVLDLAVPPLALLAMLQLAMVAASGALAAAGGSGLPLAVASGSALLFALAAGVAWASVGRERLPPATLLRVPAYLLWKLPIYARLLVSRQRSWIRTRRNV